MFFCLTVIRPWLKLPTGGHGHVTCMGDLGGVFSQENTPDGHTETHKSSFFSIKQISGRNGDHEWLRMTNAFILYDLLSKVQKSHAAYIVYNTYGFTQGNMSEQHNQMVAIFLAINYY